MKIQGIDGMTVDEIEDEVEDGAKFVCYTWVISFVILTFKRSTDIYYIRPGHSRMTKAIGPTLLSCVVGWWGFPWGVIYTIQAIATNLGGGTDLTEEVLDSLHADMR